MKDALVPSLTRKGNEILNPWEISAAMNDKIAHASALVEFEERRRALAALNKTIAVRNETLIRKSDYVVAVLEGQEIDSGVAAEVGFAYAIGKRILGYRSDLRQAGENVACRLNMQVQFFIENSGGIIVSSLDELRLCLSKSADNRADKGNKGTPISNKQANYC